MLKSLNNLILNSDSYKTSHWKQYPANTEAISSYIESRGGQFDKTLFFGLQMFLQDYLSKPITLEDIDEAQEIITAHGLPFNREGWMYILNELNGKLPIKIDAVPEGTLIPTHHVLVQVENTDPNCYWLTSYVETALIRAVWYPTTVATISWHVKQIILDALKKSCDNPEQEVLFKLHDFGARGVSSQESAAIGGCAHLVNFKGSDTIAALLTAKYYYQESMAGYSIPASEHSTMTAWTKYNEKSAYENMLDQFGGEGKTVAVVSDSYDIYNAVKNIWGVQLKEKIKTNGGTLVIRPDSGEPTVIVPELIEMLMEIFGYELNSKGFKVLPKYIRLIQGDGVNPKSIKAILDILISKGISAENVSFGMGGALLQHLNRDTLKFAMKASAVKINGKWKDVWKDPITDPGKSSKKGKLLLHHHKDNEGFDNYFTTFIGDIGWQNNGLVPVYRDGNILKKWSFKEIRDYVDNQKLK